MSVFSFSFALFVAMAMFCVTAQQPPENRKVVQEMKIEAPAMTEEDNYGYNMPDQYKCDACKGVMYHLNLALAAKQPKSRRLQEWEYQEVFDETCANGFKGFGIKLIDGKNVLSGPGLTHEEKLQAGMGAIQMGGEKWEKRMGEICRKLVYDTIGEDELYENFRTAGKLSGSLCLESTRICNKGTPSVNTEKVSKGSQKAKQSRNKKQQVAKTKKEANRNEDRRSNDNEGMDLTVFLNQLAKEHRLPTNAYTKKRSRKEWEKTLLQLAGRVYTSSASEESVTQV